MQPDELFAAVFALVVLSGVFIVVMGLRQRTQQLEMRHRERMAMIERGMAPVDTAALAPSGGAAPAASRSLTLGIVIVAVGLAMATVVSVAGGAPEAGIGVGGGIAIIGAAFIVNSRVNRRHTAPPPPMLPPNDDRL
jgi:hypothetical protein